MNFVVFFASVAWYTSAIQLAASAATGFALRLGLGDYQALIKAAFLLFLIVAGLMFLRVLDRDARALSAVLGLPKRTTAMREWATGAAIGWGIAAAFVLPIVLTRGLGTQFWVAPRAFLLTVVALATLGMNTLAVVLAFYGYGLQRLIEAAGKVRGPLAVMAIVAVHASLTPTPAGTPDGVRIAVAALGALLLCLAWMRTHAVWLGWGMYFAWLASTALLFGLPVGSQTDLNSVIASSTFGPLWLTGGEYGPEASIFAFVLLLCAIPILTNATDDFAWEYTRAPIVAGGYPVEVAAPAAHVEMEREVASVPKLVQISPVTPESASAAPADGERN